MRRRHSYIICSLGLLLLFRRNCPGVCVDFLLREFGVISIDVVEIELQLPDPNNKVP